MPADTGKVNAEILFDLDDDDEGGIVELLKDERGHLKSDNSRLHLVTYNDEDNTKVNRSIRNAFKDKLLVFSGGTEVVDDEIDEVRAFINTIARQFKMIQVKPTKNWTNFSVPNPDKNLKDLYSAMIYGWGEISRIIHVGDISKKKREKATIAPTFKMRT